MSHATIVNGGSKQTVLAGQSVDWGPWFTNDKSLPEGHAYFSVAVTNPVFANVHPSIGYQDAWLDITWTCCGQTAITAQVDLIPGCTFAVAANGVSIKATLGPKRAAPQWPGADSIDVSISGTYGHGYRMTTLRRTIQGVGINARPMRLARVPFSTHTFAKVSCPAGGPFPASTFNIFGDIGTITDNYELSGVISGVRQTGLIELGLSDRYVELTTGNAIQCGTIGYIVAF